MKRALGLIGSMCLVMAIAGVANANVLGHAAWLSSVEPVLAKVADLPDNQQPVSTGYDCTPVQRPLGRGEACSYVNSAGRFLGPGFLEGPKGAYEYDSHSGGWLLPGVPNRPDLMVSATTSSDVIQTAPYISTGLELPTTGKYQYKGGPQKPIVDRGKKVLNFYSNEVAYSSDGKWLVGAVSDGGAGIAKYEFGKEYASVIAWDAGAFQASMSTYRESNNMAVSDGGRFIAITLTVTYPDGSKKPGLRVYDTLSCRDQYDKLNYTVKRHHCEYKDLWTGEYRTGKVRGVRDVLPTAEYPRRVRFMSQDTITFDTVYDRTGANTFKVARYSLTMPERSTREYVGVLGMGDSYISGEGAAGTYYEGTDTKNNRCHQSWLSYPYFLGAEQFRYGHSVACSGAKMLDVTVAAGDPRGKVMKEDGYKGQVQGKKKWGSRNQDPIVDNFSPGYANQVVFAETFTPRTVLLSIGGNDIHFSDIVTSCVNAFHRDNCYNYYEDRVELMQQILGQHDRLVKTYKDVAQKSHGRVYVVGYPQVAKEDGNCGNNVRLNAAEVRFSSQLITFLNAVIKSATTEAGVRYVDVEAALKGYLLCEAPKGQAGVNGITKGNDSGPGPFNVIGNESYHPTAFGHKLLARAITKDTENLTNGKANVIYAKPTINPNQPLLQGVPKLNRIVRTLRWSEKTYTDTLKKEVKYVVGPKKFLKKATHFQVVIHSEPRVLAEGEVGDDPVMVSLPADLELGFHALDIYGTDDAGQPVDYREVVYVTGGATDIDGDGIANAVDSCPAWPQEGADEDGDGVDDACDGVIGSAAVETAPVLPPTQPEDVTTEQDEESLSGQEDSLLTEYIPPKRPDDIVPPTNPSDQPGPIAHGGHQQQTENTPAAAPQNRVASHTGATSALPLQTLTAVSHGFVASAVAAQPEPYEEYVTQAGATAVLGAQSRATQKGAPKHALVQTHKAKKQGREVPSVWLLAGVFMSLVCAAVLAKTFLSRTKHK